MYRLDPLHARWAAPYLNEDYHKLVRDCVKSAGDVNGAHNSAMVMAVFWSSLLHLCLATSGCGTLSTTPGQCRQSGLLIVSLMLME